MTDVVEAMARGIHDANPGLHELWANIVAAEALGNRLAERTAALRRAEARAAIRALPAGWVVAQVPGDAPYIHTGRDERTTEYANGHYDGWDACLAAVRASAVEVR